LFPESARTAYAVLILALMSLVIGAAGMIVTARSISDPVVEVSAAMAELQAGHAEITVPVYDGSEIGRLQYGFNQMVAGLAEREKLSDLFERRVGEDVARQALDRGVTLGGEIREVAVLFVDLVGSTYLVRTWPPDEVVAMLNNFFEIVVEAVGEHGGYVNKFTGDAALAIFGAPTEIADPCGAALATARALRERIPTSTELAFGIGVSAGRVVAGNVGATARYEYTVIGDAVNEAARLTELAKSSRTSTLAAAAMLDRTGPYEAAHWRRTNAVRLRGRATPTVLAEPRISSESVSEVGSNS
jgi:adenylate cyclase